MPDTAGSFNILGVDPGTTVLGFAVLEICQKELRAVEIGVVQLHKFEDHPTRLKRIFERLQGIITFHTPRLMAIEAPFYGKNPQSMLKLGRAQGVAIAAAMTNGLEVAEFSPKTIKQSVTGNGNASKEQVAAMLAQLLRAPIEETFLDATDALAAAVCCHFQSGTALGSAVSRPGVVRKTARPGIPGPGQPRTGRALLLSARLSVLQHVVFWACLENTGLFPQRQ
jgi:crossover junction endodeoxyribonuclease RuvC